MFTIDAAELVHGAMTPGFWWWLGVEPQHTLLCSQPHLYRYLHRRQERSVHDIPWVHSQLGLLQAMLCKHQEWKYKRLRALLLRYLWDYLPHGRTFAKQDGQPIPVCPICLCDHDDLHHILVECTHPTIKAHRLTVLSNAIKALRRTKSLPHEVLQYAQVLTSLLQIPDPSRLSHAIWLGRPFLPTLLLADEMMNCPSYPSSIITQLAFHLPTFLLSLFEGAIAIWKLRCKILHPPQSLPIVRLTRSAFSRLKKRSSSSRRPFASSSQSPMSSPPSSLPTPSSANYSSPNSSSQANMYSSQEESGCSDPPPLVPTYMSACVHSSVCTPTYMPVLPHPVSPQARLRPTVLESAAALHRADSNPPLSFK